LIFFYSIDPLLQQKEYFTLDHLLPTRSVTWRLKWLIT